MEKHGVAIFDGIHLAHAHTVHVKLSKRASYHLLGVHKAAKKANARFREKVKRGGKGGCCTHDTGATLGRCDFLQEKKKKTP